MKIIAALLQLKQCFAEQEGEITQLGLDKKAYDALNKECMRLCSHCCLGVCPACGRVNDDKVLGIDIFKSKS